MCSIDSLDPRTRPGHSANKADDGQTHHVFEIVAHERTVLALWLAGSKRSTAPICAISVTLPRSWWKCELNFSAAPPSFAVRQYARFVALEFRGYPFEQQQRPTNPVHLRSSAHEFPADLKIAVGNSPQQGIKRSWLLSIGGSVAEGRRGP